MKPPMNGFYLSRTAAIAIALFVSCSPDTGGNVATAALADGGSLPPTATGHDGAAGSTSSSPGTCDCPAPREPLVVRAKCETTSFSTAGVSGSFAVANAPGYSLEELALARWVVEPARVVLEWQDDPVLDGMASHRQLNWLVGNEKVVVTCTQLMVDEDVTVLVVIP